MNLIKKLAVLSILMCCFSRILSMEYAACTTNDTEMQDEQATRKRPREESEDGRMAKQKCSPGAMQELQDLLKQLTLEKLALEAKLEQQKTTNWAGH